MNKQENSFACECRCNGKRLLDAVQKPKLKQSLHYECGIYKDDTALSPMMSFHLGGDHSVPLVRVALVVLTAIATTVLFFKLRKNQ
jgi:hypothetical protein